MSNGWNFADPVEILSQLPKNFQELIASKKWQERKEALEILEKLATDNIRLDPTTNYKEIVSTLSKILGKDSNINVCAGAAKCISQIAKGLRTNFAPYVSNVTPVIFEKFKEKKSTLRDPLIETIDAVYATTNIEVMCDDVAAAIVKPNPNVKIQVNQFLYRVFKTSTDPSSSKKAIKTLTPLIVKCTGESDAEVREAAYSALGAIMNLIGKSNAMTMLGEVAGDKAKMEQVEKFYSQVQAEVAEKKKLDAELGAGAQGDGSGGGGTSEDFLKLQNLNTKLIAEKGEMKTKLDKALADNKRVHQELSKALQKITQLENEQKQMQTRNTTLQQQLTTAAKKSETLERQLASRPRAAPTPTTNGVSRPATTPLQARSNSGLTSATSRTATPSAATIQRPISSRPLAPNVSRPSGPPPVTSNSTTGLRLPSRSNSKTSIPLSAAVQKAVASGSRLPAPR